MSEPSPEQMVNLLTMQRDSERAMVKRLKVALHNQTCQTKETADQIRDKILDTLKRHMPPVETISLTGHPIEQIVGTCLAWLVCRIEDLEEQIEVLKDPPPY